MRVNVDLNYGRFKLWLNYSRNKEIRWTLWGSPGGVVMEMLIESTGEFEQDMVQFTNNEKVKIVDKLNWYIKLLSINKNLFYEHSKQLRNIKLNGKYDSSIYSLIINEDVRIILTIDDDPIFKQTVITLFRAVTAEEAPKAYDSVLEKLYQEFSIESFTAPMAHPHSVY